MPHNYALKAAVGTCVVTIEAAVVASVVTLKAAVGACTAALMAAVVTFVVTAKAAVGTCAVTMEAVAAVVATLCVSTHLGTIHVS